MPWSLDEMAACVAAEIPSGAVVNLGIGLPERVADLVSVDSGVLFHSENGLLGMGPRPALTSEDDDLINAGKKPVTLVPGGCFFHHADSFAMIRGGHIDICVMGAYEVSASGDLANWSRGTDGAPAIGGAMDLAVGAKSVYIMTTHTTKAGAPKLVETCSLPLTGRGVVSRIYTDLAVVDVQPTRGFVLRALAPGVSFEDLAARTGAQLHRH